MTSQFSVLIFMLFFTTSCFCQKITLKVIIENKVADAKNDTIYYSASRPLTWDDFKGTPDNSPGGAVTSSGFAFNADMNMVGNEVSLTVHIFTYFSKKNSWKRFQINSAYHLLHEQHHFDLTRLGAQKFYNDLLKANFTFSNYSRLLSSTFNQASNENHVLQERYDNETRHSIDTTAQLQWNDKIAGEVKAVIGNQ